MKCWVKDHGKQSWSTNKLQIGKWQVFNYNTGQIGQQTESRHWTRHTMKFKFTSSTFTASHDPLQTKWLPKTFISNEHTGSWEEGLSSFYFIQKIFFNTLWKPKAISLILLRKDVSLDSCETCWQARGNII